MGQEELGQSRSDSSERASDAPPEARPKIVVHNHNMQAIPPPPDIPDPRGDVVQFYGFPFKDDTAFYRAVVDPYWIAGEGEEPNLEIALDAIEWAARYNRITIVDVWTDMQETDIYFMLAVASASKNTRDRLTRLSEENLAAIARAAKLGGVRACWMCSTYKLHELKEMNVPRL